jgi:NhaA family Na+:H+ antiporter
MSSVPTPLKPLKRRIGSIRAFLETQAAGGVILVIATALALLWANSPFSDDYTRVWDAVVAVQVSGHGLSKDLGHWINDGLMVIFFLVVGLEIKRELLFGELSDRRQAILPVVAAAGGAIVPAAFYLALNVGADSQHGWGIPMATDIAFVVGILALLGSRVPLGLKVFVTALAIVDDLIAVLVIAFFYSSGIAWEWIGLAAAVFVVLALANRLGVTRLSFFCLFGLVLWFAMLKSGVHATIAGVLLAMTIPSHGEGSDGPSPMYRLEHALHPWVAFAIMPLFALANAGVTFTTDALADLAGALSLGIILGLVIGKPLGITLATLAVTRTRLGDLPAGVNTRQLLGAGCLAGIGFTMSLFVAELAFTNPDHADAARLGILCASLIATILGTLVLLNAGGKALPPDTEDQPANA